MTAKNYRGGKTKGRVGQSVYFLYWQNSAEKLILMTGRRGISSSPSRSCLSLAVAPGGNCAAVLFLFSLPLLRDNVVMLCNMDGHTRRRESIRAMVGLFVRLLGTELDFGLVGVGGCCAGWTRDDDGFLGFSRGALEELLRIS